MAKTLVEMSKQELLNYALDKLELKLRRKLKKPELIRLINLEKLKAKKSKKSKTSEKLEQKPKIEIPEETIEESTKEQAEESEKVDKTEEKSEPGEKVVYIDGKTGQRMNKPEIINDEMYRPSGAGIVLGEPPWTPEN